MGIRDYVKSKLHGKSEDDSDGEGLSITDLAQKLAAATIQPRPQPKPPLKQSVSDQPPTPVAHVGGFRVQEPGHPGGFAFGHVASDPPPTLNTSTPPSFPIPSGRPSRPHRGSDALPPSPGPLPKPPTMGVAMPSPQYTSLTMQYASSSGTLNPTRPSPHDLPPIKSNLQPPRASLPARPHSDPPESATGRKPRPLHQYSSPSTPKRVPSGNQTPSSGQYQARLDAIGTAASISPRRRAASTPTSPIQPSISASSSQSPSISSRTTSNAGSVQCSGRTKSGARCRRMVKGQVPLGRINPDADQELERYCHNHTKEILDTTGYYFGQEYVTFEDWIPGYLQENTKTALRREMMAKRTAADEEGYIYTFEIRDPKNKGQIQLKVGRTKNLTKRIHEWSKQCGSKEQILRGWWPGVPDEERELLKGTVVAGDPGPWVHKLERLVHLELADLTLNTPFLDPKFPRNVADLSAPRAVPVRSTCPDCGTLHKEIFTFKRVVKGKYTHKEYDLLVKPVVEKWGRFVREYV